MKLTPEHRRALVMIADAAAAGETHRILADRFKLQVIVDLITAGLATPSIETVSVGGQTVEIARVVLTAAGRLALAH
jgi:hypothetical protein